MLADHITGQRFIGIFVDGLGGQGVYFFDKGLKIIFQCFKETMVLLMATTWRRFPWSSK